MRDRNAIFGKPNILAIGGILTLVLLGSILTPAWADGKKDKKQDNPPPPPMPVHIGHVTKTRP
jgi:hypothetical protein